MLLQFSSCAFFASFKKEKIIANKDIPVAMNRDYTEYLRKMGRIYLQSTGIRRLRIGTRNEKYLSRIVYKLISNNELLLPKSSSYKFFIIDNEAPFIFSLPGYQIFISKGLIKNYFKNESILISAIAYEVIKSGRNLYRKKVHAPVGYITTSRLMSLIKIKKEDRVNIYKWTFIALKRSDFDAAAVLNWIQTMNKNSIDFNWQINDLRELSSEEYLFKTFLASQGVEVNNERGRNSSRGFYRLRDVF